MTGLKRFGILSACVVWFALGAWVLVAQCMAASEPVETAMSMAFPYRMTDQPLILHGVFGYEGPYVEDGSDREVCDVAALLVENVGSELLTNTCIAVYTPQDYYLFFAQGLPAGEKTVVLESREKLYKGEKLITCWAATAEETGVCVEHIGLRQLGMDVLEVTGQPGKELRQFVILHKNWHKETDAYLGGIMYETYVEVIKPDQILLIRPEHYAGTVSRIVAVMKDRQTHF